MAKAKKQPQTISERFGQKAGKVSPEETNSKKNRLQVPLNGEEMTALNQFLALDCAGADITTKEKEAYANIKGILAKHLQLLWVQGDTKPENPICVSDGGECIFQAVDKTGKFRLPVDEKGETIPLTKYLANIGLPKETAEYITKQVRTTPVYEITSPTVLEKSNYALANKLTSVILDSGKFTDEEIKELVKERTEVSLENGFLTTITKGLPDVSEDEKVELLGKVLEATKTVEFRISSKKFNEGLDKAYGVALQTRAPEKKAKPV